MAAQGKSKPTQQQQEEQDLLEVLVYIGRVTKVVKGGRRFSFSALVVIGDRKGRVGFGLGKAKEVSEATRKAREAAKKAMIRVPLRENRTLHHDVYGHFGSGKVILRSAPAGTGIIAGGPMRSIFSALGIHDIVAKSVGTSNPHNMVRATFDALKQIRSPKLLADQRGLKIADIIVRRETVMGIKEGSEGSPRDVKPLVSKPKSSAKKPVKQAQPKSKKETSSEE